MYNFVIQQNVIPQEDCKTDGGKIIIHVNNFFKFVYFYN